MLGSQGKKSSTIRRILCPAGHQLREKRQCWAQIGVGTLRADGHGWEPAGQSPSLVLPALSLRELQKDSLECSCCVTLDKFLLFLELLPLKGDLSSTWLVLLLLGWQEVGWGGGGGGGVLGKARGKPALPHSSVRGQVSWKGLVWRDMGWPLDTLEARVVETTRAALPSCWCPETSM